MQRQEFLEKFQDVLQSEEEFNEDTDLSTLSEWDSLAKISAAAFFDKEFKANITIEEINNFHYIADIINRLGL